MNFNSATMRLNNADTVPYLTYNSLSEIKFINHAFSTRLGGVSEGEFTSMNMAFNRGDNPDAVTENYRRICESAGFEFDSLTASAQDHHTFVRAVTRENRGVAIALAHAGWRGTVGRIGEKVVKEMGERYGTKPENITAAIGPAISVCCYEVDLPCAEHFLALTDLKPEKFVFPKEGGKFMIDLLETNRQILVAAGVKNEDITISDLCTNCNSELLWSHRATKGRRGTMSAFMCLK